MTFLATALLYPCALAALCVGAGLLVDRFSGGFLPSSLLPAVGAAGLIGLSQLMTYISALAPATPYAAAVAAAAGWALARGRLAALGRSLRAHVLPAAGAALVYALALAPVLALGRPSLSSFMALSDSAVHIMGADYLIHHGQSYAHLDLRNSYGQFIQAYYGTSYPSGADTLFGASAELLRLPLIWAYQPFNAFILATAYGPAWLLARRLRVPSGWAALAALTAVVPALVYAYALIGSVKEITALSMLLTSGALLVIHRRWLATGPTGGVPLALVLTAGVSSLGVAFGVWTLAALAVLAVVIAGELAARALAPARVLALLAVAALTALLAGLATWTQLSGSLQVAGNIASTSNSGNLHIPLRAIQVFGIWLGESYKLEPRGGDLQVTHGLVVLALVAALIGAVWLLRLRAFVLAGWLALVLLAWLVVSHSVTTWANAKTLMLTSPVIVLLAWSGVAALSKLPVRTLAIPGAAVLALLLTAGVLVSDAMQYRASNLAPTARYRELASLNSRFSGRGPALFTDFDEYALYELRALDIGGPDFVYPPPALAGTAGGYGYPVELNRASPTALQAYPLIITRRDPASARPPAAYSLVWQGAYYRVWSRRPRAAPALAHVALAGDSSEQCAQIARLAATASPGARTLTAAAAPQIVSVSLARSSHPARWGHQRAGLVMNRPGRLSAEFDLPSGGIWDVWIQGQIMPSVELAVDGRALASIAGQLSGNSLVPDTVPPFPVRISAGTHRVTVTRPGSTLAPGDHGAAVLDAILLTPAAASAGASLRSVPVSRAAELCGTPYQWVELSSAPL